MKRALILSGGGALGSYQVGALTALAEKGIEFDVIAGVSVGALNGAMLAQNDLDSAIKLWETVTEADVHHKYSTVSILYRVLREKRKGLYNARGLKKLIQDNINLNKAVKPFYIGVTSLYDEQYYALTQSDFYTNEGYLDAIYASALMPIVWEDVPEILTKNGIIRQAVDGGLRNNTPLADVLKEEPDEIYIIQCSSGRYNEKYSDTLLQVAQRTFLDIILSEVVENDTKELLKINDLVRQGKDQGFQLINPGSGKPYKCYECVSIRPAAALGNNLDFSRQALDYRFKVGYEQIKNNG